MSELYGDEYDSVAISGRRRILPDRLRRLAGAALFLALVAAMGLWAYRLGTRDAAEVPIIRAMAGPARIQPADPGGVTAAHQGLEVNAVLAGQPAPTPEASAPLAAPPAILTAEDGPHGELVLADPERFDLGDAAGDLRMPLADDAPDDALAAALDGALAEAAGPVDGPDDPAPVGFDASRLIEAVIGATPDPLAAEARGPEGPRPRSRPADLVLARGAAPAAPALRETAAVSAGARLVQLGAYDSEAITREAWGRLVERHRDLLGDKSLYIERTTANARVFYRLRVAGFESPAQTAALCEALRARAVDCIPVTLQ